MARFEPRRWHVLCAVPLLVVAAIAPAADRHAPGYETDRTLTLSDAVDAAGARHPDALTLEARVREAEALSAIADDLLAGSPQLQLRHQRDLPGEDRGLAEYEMGLNLPFKLPRRRAHERRLAELAARTAALQPGALRWRIAGLVREAVWDTALADNTARFATVEVREAEELRAAVATRVNAGDLSVADGLLADATVADKQVEHSIAVGERDAALKRYQLLTGLDRLPARLFERVPAASATLPATHPALVAAAALSARRAAEIRVTADRAVSAPSIQIGPRRERGARTDDWENSFGFNLNLPLGGGTQHKAAEASAAVALGETVAAEARLRREAEKALVSATASHAAAGKARHHAAQRTALADRHERLARIAFDAGEIELQDYLLAHGRAHAARLDAERRVLVEGRERARLRQALGDSLEGTQGETTKPLATEDAHRE